MSDNTNNGLVGELGTLARANNYIAPELYGRYSVKRGLRNDDGTGVRVGLTEIGSVRAYIMDEGEKVPTEGRLFYRGIDVLDLVRGYAGEARHGFEECAYLLLFGELPSVQRLAAFQDLMDEYRIMPRRWTPI
jgi:citrate synthase